MKKAEMLVLISKYENFLHLLQLHAEVTMNPSKVKKLISNACEWSYAHRCGNGELSEKEINKRIKKAFEKLTNTEE